MHLVGRERVRLVHLVGRERVRLVHLVGRESMRLMHFVGRKSMKLGLRLKVSIWPKIFFPVLVFLECLDE